MDFETADARLKARKVTIAVQEVKFLGIMLSVNGWRMTKEFVSAIERAERLELLRSLRSFLGLMCWWKQ